MIKRTKSLLALVVALIMLTELVPINAWAAEPATSGPCGEIAGMGDGTEVQWHFDADSGVLTISGSGKMKDFSNGGDNIAPWYRDWNDAIKKVVVQEGVTGIGWYAFYDCYNLTTVQMPAGVTDIGVSAFQNCRSLLSVTIPKGVTTIQSSTFQDCHNLATVVIPDSVTKIRFDAFKNCRSLKNITLPDSVTDIETSAFSGCSQLTRIVIPENITRIERNVFYDCRSLTDVSIPDGVRNIGQSAFSGCSSLEHLTLPDSITRIEEHAFTDSGLTDVYIPPKVTAIEDRLFEGCPNLTHVTIPENITSIGGYVFHACENLISVSLPDSVQSIGGAVFWDCYKLETVNIPDGVSAISGGMFSGCSSLKSIHLPDSIISIERGAFTNCRSLTEIAIPDGITHISDRTFSSCSSLKKVSIPNSVTTIGESAFDGCGFTTITIPDSVTTIGNNAFAYCSNLIRLTIPDSVVTIGDGAFQRSQSLLSVSIPDSVTTIGKNAFWYCVGFKDIYYAGSEEQWHKISIGADAIAEGVTIHFNSDGSEINTAGTIIGAFGQYDAAANTLSIDGKTYAVGSTCAVNASALSGKRIFCLVENGEVKHIDALENIGSELQLITTGEPNVLLRYVDGQLTGNIETYVNIVNKLSYDFPAGYDQALIASDEYFRAGTPLKGLVSQLDSTNFTLTLDSRVANSSVPFDQKPWLATLTIAPGNVRPINPSNNGGSDRPSTGDNSGGSDKPSTDDNSGGYIDYDGGYDGTYDGTKADNGASSGSSGNSTSTAIPKGTPAQENSATPEQNTPVMTAQTFTDVSDTAWYYAPVKYVYDKGIMTGTATAAFSPNATTTRAMVVSILHRLEKNPQVTTGLAFADVADDAYYAKAVAWAAAKGLVSGYDSETFGAEDAITREQLAVILQRYAAYKGYDITEPVPLSGYQDTAQVSDYALSSLQWAVAKGFITGTSAKTLAPQDSATRAQVATIIMRWCEFAR